jgi:hypothetical protein
MTPRITLISAVVGAAFVLVVPALGDSWGADQNEVSVHVSPDLGDRVAALRQEKLFAVLDARERSLGTIAAVATAARPEPVHDDHFRSDPSIVPPPMALTRAGGGIDWSQLGIGFAVGVLLMLCVRWTLVASAAMHRDRGLSRQEGAGR